MNAALKFLHSEQFNEVAAALAKAQGAMEPPRKARTARVRMRAEKGGGEYTYNYADLGDIVAACRKPLSENGVALSQPIDGEAPMVTTLLIHSSGQYLGCTYNLPKGLAAQEFGSALTYARRYSLCSLLGIVAEDDDDGRGAQAISEREAKNARKAQSQSRGITPPKANAEPRNQGGTSGPELAKAPAGATLEEVQTKIKAAYVVYMKLFPNEDLPGHCFARYGTAVRQLQVNEAWDWLQWVEGENKKALGEAT